MRLLAAAALLVGLSGATASAPTIAGCPVFPASSVWNQKVDTLPVASDSAQLIASMGVGGSVHADFGNGLYDGSVIGIPYVVVHAKSTPKSRVTFEYADESDKGPYPIPKNVPVEGYPGHADQGDRHVLIVDRDACRLYELSGMSKQNGKWSGWSGAIWNLRSNALRPAGWTSADAAGLPILAGLAIYGEAASGAIRHALRFTAPCTSRHYVYPARHEAGSCGNAAPPMGLRVRLKAGVNISHLPRQARIVAQALKTYGMILADNGSPWYISGAPSPHWNDDALHQLDQLRGRDFQVVDTSSLPHPGR